MKKSSLEILVERAARNDEGAFEELYKKYYKSVYFAALKLCKSDADAQDITQLTFVKVQKSIHTLQQPDYFPLWLNRICMNVAKNFFRRNKDVAFSDEYFLLHNQAIETRPEYVTQTYWHKQNDIHVCSSLINELKPEQREMLTLFYFQNKSYEVISKQLDMPIGTVKSRLYYARNELQKRIMNYEKKENIKLDFKAEIIGSAIMMLCLTKQASMIPKVGYFSFLQGITHKFPKSVAIKITMATGLCMANVVAIGYASQVYEQVRAKDDSYMPLMNTVEVSSFNTIKIDTYSIENEVDAYYLLMNWGYDRHSLKSKAKEDLQKMLPLYEELKKQNGLLYQVLKDKNWAQDFEEVSKK